MCIVASMRTVTFLIRHKFHVRFQSNRASPSIGSACAACWRARLPPRRHGTKSAAQSVLPWRHARLPSRRRRRQFLHRWHDVRNVPGPAQLVDAVQSAHCNARHSMDAARRPDHAIDGRRAVPNQLRSTRLRPVRATFSAAHAARTAHTTPAASAATTPTVAALAAAASVTAAQSVRSWRHARLPSWRRRRPILHPWHDVRHFPGPAQLVAFLR